MCGICGFASFEQDFSEQSDRWNQVLVAMRTSIAHRGRNSAGEMLGKHIGLGHARLSIRDLSSAGAQPMVRRVGGVEYAIVYNGEIYNVDEIQPTLRSAGYHFETATDTEVILYAYIHYGAEFMRKLNGIYALAIWDGGSETLSLYRDRLGVKPLFWGIRENSMVFGSELKALFCHPYVTPEIDHDSLREVFAIGPARTPGNGVFRDIHEVLPGQYIRFSADGLKKYQYWKLEAREHTDGEKQTVETVSFLVRDAITRQLVSDVSVCSFLSGGIDSSIVTAVAADYLGRNGDGLNTFSFDFKDNDIFFSANAFQPERDRPFVDLMLKTCNVRHNYLECDEEELIRYLYTAVAAKDLPGMADVDASLLYFCSLVAKRNKVALTGECADEIFGGYPWFYREDLQNLSMFSWSHDMRAREALLSPDVVSELHLEEYAQSRYLESIAKVPRLEGESKADKKCRETTHLNIQWFMQTLLDRMDRASMHYGLEARVPFADHRIIEYVYNVPWAMKYRNGTAKWLLREACGDLLPKEIMERKKSPYPKTYHPNYERLLIEAVRSILGDHNSPILPLLDEQKVQAFLKAPAEYGKPWFGQLMAGPQLLAYMIQVNEWLSGFR